MLTVYHNPRCSKSRDVLQILEEQGVKYKLLKYLETPMNETQLMALLEKLQIPAKELLRTKEPIFQEKFAHKKMTELSSLRALLKFPVLMERPIVVKGKKAIIARPPEKVLEII